MDDLGLLIATVDPGESINGFVCPFCHGGQKNEKSFSITSREDGLILYICHRNKCKEAYPSSGVQFSDGKRRKIKNKQKPGKIFDKPLKPLSKEDYRAFDTIYDIGEELIRSARFKKTEDGWICMPCFGPDGHLRGRVLRQFSPKRVLSYKEPQCSHEPLLSWYYNRDRLNDIKPYVVIVEDILSALKVSTHHNAVALNGTSISITGIMELLDNSKVQYLILDGDATATAFQLKRRWKNVLDIRVIEALRDPKFWHDVSIQNLQGTLKA